MRRRPDAPVALYWPHAADGGARFRVAGGGVSRHARNPDGARALLEWLATDAGQAAFSVVRSDLTLGELGASGLDLAPYRVAEFAFHYGDAVLLAERAHYR